MSTFYKALFLLAIAASAYAQQGGDGQESFFEREADKFITAHAVIGTVTVGLLFPAGAIMIRLMSSPKTWLVHGIFQTASYIFFAAAVGLGIYIAKESDQMNDKHPIIGIIMLGVLFFEPVLGYMHHRSVVKTGRRSAISYIHIWIGRAIIALGIINGGFGLQLSQGTTGQIVGYSVAGGLVWLVYVASASVGESRRRKIAASKTHYTDEQDMYEKGVRSYSH